MPGLVYSSTYSHDIPELKSLIQQRTEFITNDCDSLIIARTFYDLIDKWDTGGGNFLMAVGQFSILNFLAKVYLHLCQPDNFFSRDKKEEYTRKKEAIKIACPDQKQFINNIPNPRIGDVNETYAFTFLVRSLPPSIDLGIVRYEISPEEIWGIYRNLLTHMAWPGASIASRKYTNLEARTKTELHRHIDLTSTTSFYKVGMATQCNVDKLNIDLIKISSWICVELENSKFTQENVRSTLDRMDC